MPCRKIGIPTFVIILNKNTYLYFLYHQTILNINIMNLKFVNREKIRISKRRSSKFRQLVESLGNLTSGGQALEVTFTDVKELNSIRNIVYTYNRETGIKIKSGKDSENNRVFFYRD